MASEESAPKQGSKSENEASKRDDAKSPVDQATPIRHSRQRYLLGKVIGNLPRGYAAEFFPQFLSISSRLSVSYSTREPVFHPQ